MDPNATLDELRKRMAELGNTGSFEWEFLELDRMVELFQSLDQWISKGGFLPADWNKR